ncbi:MAG: hypothetical protein B9S38_02475 [Verrucomicrobiia bacterium Tous-C4TDCM]|nr:MAG: hypothetical protein B9S38_02475 [Verrucomicrobiae bacterium Tous-C4TDCM]
MPVYEYQTPEGQSVLLHRPVEDRDLPAIHEGQVLRRKQVPTCISVGVGAKPETMSQKTWKGYRDMELRGGLRHHGNYLPPETVKKALLAPEVD